LNTLTALRRRQRPHRPYDGEILTEGPGTWNRTLPESKR
jgi:hypothetical protein